MAFNWIYQLTPQTLPYELDFKSVGDPDMDPLVLRERQAKERSSLKALAALTPRLATMRDFHRWLFTEHGA